MLALLRIAKHFTDRCSPNFNHPIAFAQHTHTQSIRYGLFRTSLALLCFPAKTDARKSTFWSLLRLDSPTQRHCSMAFVRGSSLVQLVGRDQSFHLRPASLSLSHAGIHCEASSTLVQSENHLCDRASGKETQHLDTKICEPEQNNDANQV